MTVVRYMRCAIALILCTAVFQLWVHRSDKLARTSVATADNMELHVNKSSGKPLTNLTSVSVVNVVLPASFQPRYEKFPCRKMTLTNMTFPICHFTGDYISAFLARGKYYEGGLVSRFVRLLRLDRQLQLIDIGANIGVYSLPAARVAHVIAVEPNWRAMLRLAKSVDLGGVSSNITLVHNAVHSDRRTVSMSITPGNQGGGRLTKCKLTPNKSCDTSVLASVRTILLNDLLPLTRSKSALIKVDVEGHEADIFTEPSAGQFFDQVDVPSVELEWVFCKRRSAHIVQRLINFFYSRNYTAFTLRNTKLETHYRSWPYNIMFKKGNRTDIVL